MSRPEGVIKLAIAGASGKMGSEVARAACRQEDIELVAAIDLSRVGESLKSVGGNVCPDLIIEDKLGAALDRTQPNVLVELTHPGAAADHALVALKRGIAPIIGTSGLSSEDLREIKRASEESSTPVMVVPNFAVGAVLMMRFAEMAAKWLPDVEIIEMHHDQKLDAPSGTARSTAERVDRARRERPRGVRGEMVKVEGSRGGNVKDVRVHSVRLPGLVAHQMVVFGGPGETLTIRHDSLDRASFMAGVLLCVRRIWDFRGLTVGMDSLFD